MKNQQLILYIVLSVVIIAGAALLYEKDNELTGQQLFIFSQNRDQSFLANGEACSRDQQCFSSYCFARKCQRPFASLDGGVCSENRQCRSGFCYSGMCTPVYSLKQTGSSCMDSKECTSKACHNGRCIAGNYPLGERCTIDEQCISEFCFSGKCQRAWTVYTGNNCIENKQCQSGICNLGRCQPPLGTTGPTLINDLRGLFLTGKLN